MLSVKKAWFWSIVLLAVSFSPAGTLLFSDDFEIPSVSSGQYPDVSADADPSAQIGTWVTLYEENPYDIQVTRDGTLPQPGPAQGEQYLGVYRQVYAFLRGNFSQTANQTYLSVSFDLYVDADSDHNKGFHFFLRNNTDSSWETDIVINDMFRANGNISHYTTLNTHELIDTFQTGQWNRVHYLINFREKKYRLSVNGRIYEELVFYTDAQSPSAWSAKQVNFIATTPGSLFYLDNVQVKSMREYRTSYISTGDNLWVLWLPMDSPDVIKTAINAINRDWDVSRIFWRGAQDELWHNDYKIRKENQFYYHLMNWIDDRLIYAGGNQAALDACKDNNMDIYAVYGLFECSSPADIPGAGFYPYFAQDYLTVENPEWVPVNKYGTRLQGGPVELAYPEARQKLIERFTDFAVDRGYQGFAFYTYAENWGLRYLDEFGYNQPIVDEFKRRYGVDIRTESFDKEAWARLRGEYVTQFLRELHASFKSHGKKICVWLNRDTTHLPQYWGVTPLTPTAGNIYMDWERWVDEGIVDELTVYWPGYQDVINEVFSYCRNTDVHVSIMTTYGIIPVDASRLLMSGGDVETGYGYDNMIGYGGENTPSEPLSSLYGSDVYAKRRVLYLIEKGTLSATVADIVPVLNDPDIYVRRGALRAFLTLNNDAAIPYIENALKDPENAVRCQAAVCLGALNDGDSLQKAIDVVADQYTFQYAFVALTETFRGMKNAGRITSVDIPVFLNALDHPDPNVRRAVLRNLYQMGCGEYPDLKNKAAQMLLGDPDAFTRELAILVLLNFGGINQYLEQAMLFDAEEFVRMRAARWYTGDMELLVDLFRQFGAYSSRSDREWGYRTVADSLINYFGDQGKNRLVDILNEKNDPLLSEYAFKSVYIPLDRQGYMFTTEEQDEIAHRHQVKINFPSIPLFADTFENIDAPEEYPDETEDLDPVASAGDWSQIAEQHPYSIQVTRDHDPGAFERGRYLVCAESAAVTLRGNFVPNYPEYSNYPFLIVKFDFYLDENAADGFIFSLRNSQDHNFDRMVLSTHFDVDGNIYHVTASGSEPSGLTIRPGRWYTAVYRVDPAAGNFELSVAGNEAASMPFYSDESMAGQMCFTAAGTGAVFMLDDILAHAKPLCGQWIETDINNDCRTDFADFAQLARDWLN